MKRLVTLAGAAVVAVLGWLPGVASAAPSSPSATSSSGVAARPAIPPVIIFNQAPVFNDYLDCVGGHVYTDFVDPDGDDALMSVQLAVYRPSVGHWTYHAMTNTGPTVHGVFFWTELADHGINPATVSGYAFRATDQAGIKSGWVYADGDCDLS